MYVSFADVISIITGMWLMKALATISLSSHSCRYTTVANITLSLLTANPVPPHPNLHKHYAIHNNNNTRLMALFLELPKWAGTRKVEPIWIYWNKR